MHDWDVWIAQFVNSYVGRFPFFDKVVGEVLALSTFKLMPIVAFLCWIWFTDGPDRRLRHIVIDGLAGGFVALVVTRLMQNLGPEHPRPALAGILTHEPTGTAMEPDWSSFPSDTSALAFALAFAIFLAARGPGIVALLWAGLLVSFPRLYGGYHYPSDLIAGALIGIVCVWAFAQFRPLSSRIYAVIDNMELRRRPLFYAFFFIATFQIGTYFSDIRKVGTGTLKAIGVVRLAEVHQGQPQQSQPELSVQADLP